MYYDKELYHHGVLGQKWGVRRYQHQDGTRTSLGKKHERTLDSNDSGKTKNSFSVKASGHKAMAKVYSLNEKTYAKSNKTLSSMNKAAKNAQLKKAEEAQNKANAKKEAKNAYKQTDEYKEKVAKRNKAIKVGAAVAGTVLVAYGAYKVNQYVRGKNAEIRMQEGLKSCENFMKNSSSYKNLSDSVTGNAAKAANWKNGLNNRVVEEYKNAARQKARNDSFFTAAKNVYSDYRKYKA